ncbi:MULTISPECIES: response regulator transcription factor [unclassified Clostridium]|jgi:DNA-binding response regulator, luxR family|uniref:response regulator transcription factor n=1 Tax=unclassified Clostridium TaxID=2614128 RepID=UPI0025BD3438|nr:response regulator transcription factor [Clostridium sp.]MCI6692640.1 response regulator transcription factor [Clostridium sp.]MDY2631242.1 response regulator transcription factor [Clostridium sp.]MDY4251620.1 response regulator transcription factor [Clostridium sp.]MDY6228502.1 response regulator transcription factor [Clostridium sp.]
MSIKLVIADDDELIRESLKIILSYDNEIEVVDTFENGKDLVEFLLRNTIDVALVDVRMPLINGVKATLEISKNTNTKVVILTTFDEDEYISEGIRNGAKGYLLKNTKPDKIIETIKLVNNGIAVIQEEILNKLSNNLISSIDKKEKIDESIFTERELEVMKAVSEGLSNKEISKKLYISEGTVKNYITSILQKTNLTHRTQIAIYYLKGI